VPLPSNTKLDGLLADVPKINSETCVAVVDEVDIFQSSDPDPLSAEKKTVEPINVKPEGDEPTAPIIISTIVGLVADVLILHNSFPYTLSVAEKYNVPPIFVKLPGLLLLAPA
jgi:hypothetical protein